MCSIYNAPEKILYNNGGYYMYCKAREGTSLHKEEASCIPVSRYILSPQKK